MTSALKWQLHPDYRQRRDWLHDAVAAGRIAPADFFGAQRALDLTPAARGWALILTGTFAAAGLALLAAALVFAVAFNWDALGHFARFAMVQALLLLFGFAAWWRGVETVTGEAALFAAALATGALLALFGQTYQTGADPYSLFTVWALLLLPWLLHARRAALWLLWVVIANTGLSLYCGQVQGEAAWMRWFGHLQWSATLVILFNGALLIGFERLPALGTAGLARALPRTLAVIVLGAVAAILVPLIGWRPHPDTNAAYQTGLALLSVAAFAAIAWWHTQQRRDIVVLAAAALCAVSVGYALLVRILPGHANFSLFSLSAAYWIGAIAGAVAWLRSLAPAAATTATTATTATEATEATTATEAATGKTS